MVREKYVIKQQAEYSTEYVRDLDDLFGLFTLPRMEYHSRDDPDFWLTSSSHRFAELFLSQVNSQLYYILQSHFTLTEDIEEIIDSNLGNFMSGNENITIRFYGRERHPIGFKLEPEGLTGDVTATMSRNHTDDVSFGDPDRKNFERMYEKYRNNKTDQYNEDFDFESTLTIKNTKEYITYDFVGGRYNHAVRHWNNPAKEKPSTAQKIRQFFSF